MLGKSIALFTREKRAARGLMSCLQAAGNEVVWIESARETIDLIEGQAVDLVMLDCADEVAAHAIVDAATARVPVVAIAANGEPTTLLDLVCDHNVEHLLMRSNTEGLAGLDRREVLTTVEKILRQDLFGIDKYLTAFGVELCQLEVTCAEDRDSIVEQVSEYACALGAGRELGRVAAMITDELVTNAVYNAPVRPDGRPRYASRNRRDKIALDPCEYAHVRFGSDGFHLAISVTDYFGRLTPERIRDGMRRCLSGGDQIEQKPGGAGIGLYEVMQSCNQLVFNLHEGKRTEVVAILNIADRMRSVREAGHSLHVFTSERSRLRALARASVPETIVVSESLRVDMRQRTASERRPAVVVPLARRKRTVRAPTDLPETRRGELVVFPDETMGIDTMFGLIRGARTPVAALEHGMRFLATAYGGVIAYVADGGTLMPWFGTGTIADWELASRVPIPVESSYTLARLARDGVAAAFRPTDTPLDEHLARLTAGDTGKPGAVVPVAADGVLRYALLAFAPKYGRHMAAAVMDRLHRELDGAITRWDLYDQYESITIC